ncbi:hypothetical protein [Actinomadura roseirufa]|uniref:hypothetical protein n=1 Tax=Actinomadura roseirufa TaxID=2094049 RepID=UPI0013F15189|nr:hypothetical protein [Actinomadura roseirufa]
MIIVRLELRDGLSPDALEITAVTAAFQAAACADDALEHLRVQTSDREIAVAVFVRLPGLVQATLRAWQICLRALDGSSWANCSGITEDALVSVGSEASTRLT